MTIWYVVLSLLVVFFFVLGLLMGFIQKKKQVNYDRSMLENTSTIDIEVLDEMVNY